jgi:hypothetical protein
MGELLFEVRAPAWWTIGAVTTCLVLGVAMWHRAAVELPRAVAPARAAVVLVVLVGMFVLARLFLEGIAVYPDRVTVTAAFAMERRSYTLDQVRWYDTLTVAAGIGIRSRVRRAVTIGFSDATEFQVLENRLNFDRLRGWLAENKVPARP